MSSEKRRPLPTITDVARKAGTSTATVDRVLNRRAAVRENTMRRVLDAALALGYLHTGQVEALREPEPIKLALLLPRGTNPYLALVNEKARAFIEHHHRDARVKSFFIDGFDPDELSHSIRRHGKTADGVIFMAIDHPSVRMATNELVAAGKKVITFISDISTSRRHAYVGIDNFAAGRTAALLLGRFTGHVPGRVALIAASRIYRAHLEREVGFLGLIEERFPHIAVSATREGHDDRKQNYEHTRRLLEKHPDITGIYNVGGSSDGIGRALQESGRAQEVTFIGHGLTHDTRAMLADGTMDAVITQNPDRLFEAAVAAAMGKEGTQVPMELYVAENLPQE
ncbi:LacI family DNA-binding transcriptional regulator [Halomonas elongata]|uniref:LacI family DNA-binding transcriptional regulator n=1 Tax=Halomonas elongata (strain ATCC 33173 / DSM 2581 / NBRC 15536 / NCIMB 2198 / 1H9) TaxID=768066 RepID=E1V6N0_HALED|nr:LacI family DNA-binding transcriptional regulator [Halomonas elongata]WBF18593.1 LacI family DNA-binding transcriptional regulator [Halomonas elongata]WPU47447.1 LacI family DNA-binding transcriptional regulator [Halomonas elongata DSM 2581]CBV41359.1 LacI family transcription regulator [Halomonas elongata DSM 2581]